MVFQDPDQFVIQTSADRSAGRSAGRAAQKWFSDTENVKFCREFEAEYFRLPRKLCVEIALDSLDASAGPSAVEERLLGWPRPPIDILDVGCGTGSNLLYLQERRPEAKIIGIDPEPAMIDLATETKSAEIIQATIENAPFEPESFDLIISHSNFRLWNEPVEGLKKIYQLLKPGGLAYILDLRGDVTPDLRQHLLERLDSEIKRQFFASQLEAAYTPDQIKNFLEQAAITHYTLGLGGLGGYPIRSSAAFALLQKNEYIAELVFRLSQEGFRSSRSADATLHLYIRRPMTKGI